MFKNKAPDGNNNICGETIRKLRLELGLSQRALADLLQIDGFDIGKNGIQKIESGERFVTDVEIAYFSHLFKVTSDQLLGL